MTCALFVAPISVSEIWPHVKHFIALCDGDVSTSSDLLPLLERGERHLVVVVEGVEIKGACVYRVVNGFKKKALITTLGGDGGDWNAAIKSFSSQLKTLGFERLEIQGRKGWEKLLEGFNRMHVTIGKEL